MTSRRAHDREPCDFSIKFTVLYMESADFKRESFAGKAIDKSSAGIGLVTDFPLEPGHVLEWDDRHQEGRLHIALVKWAQESDGQYRAGIMFI
ncbi:MAG: hypothetical protein HZB33_14525 [Nitrospirae bacterium]|nr:hypothetical protein [Nitrospirota bacterium]